MDKISRVRRLGVYIAATGEFVRLTKNRRTPHRNFRDVVAEDVVALVVGVTSLPLSVQVELEVIFEVSGRASVLESKPIHIETRWRVPASGRNPPSETFKFVIIRIRRETKE